MARDQLLGQPARAYEKYDGFAKSGEICRNVAGPARRRLLQMRREGHKVVLILTSGSPIKMSKWRIRDEFQGVVYSTIYQYIDALEEYARRTTRWSQPSDYKARVNECVRGRGQLNGRSCVENSNVRYFHIGFVILDPRFGDDPKVVHFYGDPKYKFLKASIFVESLDSFLRADRLTHCDTTLLKLGRRMESKLFKFLRGDHAQQVLAQGSHSYNLVAHPWKTLSQNCNIWVSEVLASAYFVTEDSWPKTDRALAKRVLSQTSFRPVKVPLTGKQRLGRVAAPFIGGINSEEGNIDHYYGVADIVPARSIIEWLDKLGQFRSIETVQDAR